MNNPTNSYVAEKTIKIGMTPSGYVFSEVVDKDTLIQLIKEGIIVPEEDYGSRLEKK